MTLGGPSLQAIGCWLFFVLVVVPEVELVLRRQQHVETTLQIWVPTEQDPHAVHNASTLMLQSIHKR
jgi:hypothetical protein